MAGIRLDGDAYYRVMSYKPLQAPELSIGRTASSQEEYTVYSGSSYQTNSFDSSIYSNYTKKSYTNPSKTGYVG